MVEEVNRDRRRRRTRRDCRLRRRTIICGLIAALLSGLVMSVASPGRASTSPPGLIVFDTSEGGATSHVYTVHPDGSHLHRLPTGPGAFLPRLSADGRLVTYVSAATGTDEIYVMGVDGNGKRQITNDARFNNFAPTFSPDGSRIAFSRCSHFYGTCDIASIGLNGRGLRTLAGGYWHHTDPVYSPDGSRIAFASDQGGYESLVRIMPARGGRSRSIGPVSLTGGRPDWSPDGTRIAFVGNLRHGQVFLIRPDGSHLHAITQAGEEFIFAMFSPDGRMLVAENAGAARRGLELMNADGSHPRPIPSLPAGAGFPDWGVLR